LTHAKSFVFTAVYSSKVKASYKILFYFLAVTGARECNILVSVDSISRFRTPNPPRAWTLPIPRVL
jgi:hypothetical protein